MSLIDEKSLNYGNIIWKCNLVNCIKVTEEYVNTMRESNYQEFICSIYEEGRYAWMLENIEILKEPIKAKGCY